MSIVETVLQALNGTRLAARALGHDTEELSTSVIRPARAEARQEQVEDAADGHPASSEPEAPDDSDGGLLDVLGDALDWLLNIF